MSEANEFKFYQQRETKFRLFTAFISETSALDADKISSFTLLTAFVK